MWPIATAFTWHNVFKVHTCCNMYRGFIFIYIKYLISVLWHRYPKFWLLSHLLLGAYFQLGPNGKSTWEHLYEGFRVDVKSSSLLGTSPAVALQTHVVTLWFTFWGTAKLPFKVSAPLRIPGERGQGLWPLRQHPFWKVSYNWSQTISLRF